MNCNKHMSQDQSKIIRTWLVCTLYKSVTNCKFLARKVNMVTLSSLRQDRLSDTIFPLVLNRRLDATLVAGIHKYFFARQAK